MKIVGVSTVYNEPQIGRTIHHMRTQGVDQLLISAGDQATMMLAHDADAIVCRSGTPFDQGAEITALAHRARTLGADWIVPFDADEYWVGTNGRTIRDALAHLPAEIDTVAAPMFLHLTPADRAVNHKPLPKVAFRARHSMTVAWGQHDVTGIEHWSTGSLIVREWQYESWDHFQQKLAVTRQLHEQPHMRNSPHGTHRSSLLDLSERELRQVWANHLATPTIVDPIPGSDTWTS
jgi:hypothetical protein